MKLADSLRFLRLSTLANLWVDLFSTGLPCEADCANISGMGIALAGEDAWIEACDKAQTEAGIIDFPIVE